MDETVDNEAEACPSKKKSFQIKPVMVSRDRVVLSAVSVIVGFLTCLLLKSLFATNKEQLEESYLPSLPNPNAQSSEKEKCKPSESQVTSGDLPDHSDTSSPPQLCDEADILFDLLSR